MEPITIVPINLTFYSRNSTFNIYEITKFEYYYISNFLFIDTLRFHKEIFKKMDFWYIFLHPFLFVRHFNYSIKTFNEKLGYNPKTNLKTGIPKLLNWFEEYHNV